MQPNDLFYFLQADELDMWLTNDLTNDKSGAPVNQPPSPPPATPPAPPTPEKHVRLETPSDEEVRHEGVGGILLFISPL